jgi:hypothetical protein
MSRRARTPARLAVLLTLTLALASAASAQTPFSLFALGQNVDAGTARDTGRGGWGMAAADTLTPGTLNPAAAADLRYASLVFSGSGERVDSAGPDGGRLTRRVIVPDVRLAVPLKSGRLALHTGYNVKRSMEWESRQVITMDHFGETVTGFERYKRSGSLWQVPIGLSWRTGEALAVAASVNLVRGSITDQIDQLFVDPLDNYYLPNTRTQKDELSGTSWTVAMLLDGPGPISLGASFTSAYDLKMARETSLGGVAARSYETFDAAMPEEYRAGVMFDLGRHWRIGADGQLARYGALTGRADWEPVLEDEWTFGAGIERELERTQFGRRYRAPVRAGFQWRRWAHAVGGSPVDERTVSVGTGLPFRNRLGVIDLSLSYSWIGDQAENGYRSNVWRLGVSLTGLEPLVF